MAKHTAAERVAATQADVLRGEPVLGAARMHTVGWKARQSSTSAASMFGALGALIGAAVRSSQRKKHAAELAAQNPEGSMARALATEESMVWALTPSRWLVFRASGAKPKALIAEFGREHATGVAVFPPQAKRGASQIGVQLTDGSVLRGEVAVVKGNLDRANELVAAAGQVAGRP